jgi:integrase
MASIGLDRNGRRRILFVAGDGGRKTIRLGKMSQRQAEAFKVKVESLVAQIITGSADDEVSRWMAGLDDLMHSRIAAVGLIKGRQTSRSLALGLFIDGYIEGRSDIKPNTRIGLGQARRNLIAFFGVGKPLGDISEGDAEEYRRYLMSKLSVNTVRRLCGRAKQFFRFAVRKRIIRDNPFAGLESNVRSNPARQFFVTRKMADAVIEACPDFQWRLIVALSRYGGVRCPSETLALTWADVEWDHNRIRVPSPLVGNAPENSHSPFDRLAIPRLTGWSRDRAQPQPAQQVWPRHLPSYLLPCSARFASRAVD